MHTDEFGAFSEFRSVGTISFDSRGHGTKNDTLWFRDFSISPSQNAVAYSIQPDCSFTFAYENGETFQGVIIDGGQKLLWLETSGDPVRSGQAERVRSAQ